MQLSKVTHRYRKKCRICAERLPGTKFPRDDWHKPRELKQKWAPRKKTCWDCYKSTEEYKKYLPKDY
jgi:hypothetical protein